LGHGDVLDQIEQCRIGSVDVLDRHHQRALPCSGAYT
jgi:hypothetical protein